MILEMFHVKHFGPVPPQKLTWAKTAGALDEVRRGKMLVRKKSGGHPTLGTGPRRKNPQKCKIGYFRRPSVVRDVPQPGLW
jgi:hypothetical protein